MPPSSNRQVHWQRSKEPVLSLSKEPRKIPQRIRTSSISREADGPSFERPSASMEVIRFELLSL